MLYPSTLHGQDPWGKAQLPLTYHALDHAFASPGLHDWKGTFAPCPTIYPSESGSMLGFFLNPTWLLPLNPPCLVLITRCLFKIFSRAVTCDTALPAFVLVWFCYLRRTWWEEKFTYILVQSVVYLFYLRTLVSHMHVTAEILGTIWGKKFNVFVKCLNLRRYCDILSIHTHNFWNISWKCWNSEFWNVCI